MITQFTDDTSLTIWGEEPYVRAMVHTLDQFRQASGLIINELNQLPISGHTTLQSDLLGLGAFGGSRRLRKISPSFLAPPLG
jgi:hypothetical protein